MIEMKENEGIIPKMRFFGIIRKNQKKIGKNQKKLGKIRKNSKKKRKFFRDFQSLNEAQPSF